MASSMAGAGGSAASVATAAAAAAAAAAADSKDGDERQESSDEDCELDSEDYEEAAEEDSEPDDEDGVPVEAASAEAIEATRLRNEAALTRLYSEDAQEKRKMDDIRNRAAAALVRIYTPYAEQLAPPRPRAAAAALNISDAAAAADASPIAAAAAAAADAPLPAPTASSGEAVSRPSAGSAGDGLVSPLPKERSEGHASFEEMKQGSWASTAPGDEDTAAAKPAAALATGDSAPGLRAPVQFKLAARGGVGATRKGAKRALPLFGDDSDDEPDAAGAATAAAAKITAAAAGVNVSNADQSAAERVTSSSSSSNPQPAAPFNRRVTAATTNVLSAVEELATAARGNLTLAIVARTEGGLAQVTATITCRGAAAAAVRAAAALPAPSADGSGAAVLTIDGAELSIATRGAPLTAAAHFTAVGHMEQLPACARELNALAGSQLALLRHPYPRCVRLVAAALAPLAADAPSAPDMHLSPLLDGSYWSLAAVGTEVVEVRVLAAAARVGDVTWRHSAAAADAAAAAAGADAQSASDTGDSDDSASDAGDLSGSESGDEQEAAQAVGSAARSAVAVRDTARLLTSYGPLYLTVDPQQPMWGWEGHPRAPPRNLI
eukprot:TRINITY_DN1627_c0_g2_i3.p1 TRINITY_DN1627_c0_g2~~TRINITY_DN1627_c0_g2_i3.p1  ORF type:complete len:609 (+),score=209.85 TRINITY_DN1627_c0_g2_i3:1382-3208(+)